MVKKKNVSDVKLVEEVLDEDSAHQARLAKADTGVIEDPRVLRIMYEEKCVMEAALQANTQRGAYDRRLENLRNELNGILRHWDAVQKTKAKKIASLRQELEGDYGINMMHWGFDDEAAVLVKLPPEVIDQIDVKKDHSKLKESEEKSEESDRGAAT